jgi:hypothetical protein
MVMTLDERIRDKLKRHESESPNARSNPERRDDYIRAVARRASDRLFADGLVESSAATGNMVPDGG